MKEQSVRPRISLASMKFDDGRSTVDHAVILYRYHDDHRKWPTTACWIYGMSKLASMDWTISGSTYPVIKHGNGPRSPCIDYFPIYLPIEFGDFPASCVGLAMGQPKNTQIPGAEWCGRMAQLLSQNHRILASVAPTIDHTVGNGNMLEIGDWTSRKVPPAIVDGNGWYVLYAYKSRCCWLINPFLHP